MVRQQDWYDPSVFKRIRTQIKILLLLIALVMLFINQGWIIRLFNIFSEKKNYYNETYHIFCRNSSGIIFFL